MIIIITMIIIILKIESEENGRELKLVGVQDTTTGPPKLIVIFDFKTKFRNVGGFFTLHVFVFHLASLSIIRVT